MSEYLTHDGRRFVWTGPFETKALVDRAGAGFRWNDPQCPRKWSTEDATRALQLRKYADQRAAERLAPLAQQLDASRAKDAAPGIELPVPVGCEPLPFQRAGVQFAVAALARGTGVLIGDEPGLGKTIQALVTANSVGAQSLLVVCPASLRINWLREAKKWLIKEHEAFVVTSGKDAIPATATLVIVNDDLAWKDEIAAQLRARQWDMLVVDEAHRMKSPDTKRSRGVLGWYDRKKRLDVPGLADSARRLALLSGTPFTNRPKELWSLLRAVDRNTWGNFFRYAIRYCAAHQNEHGWDFDGASNLGELQTRLRSTVMVRRLKADVLADLPAKRRQVLAIPANGLAPLVQRENETFAAHEDLLQDLTAKAELAHAGGDNDLYAAAVAQLQEAEAASFGEMAVIRHEIAVAKAPKVVEHVLEQLEAVDKIVVFGHHKEAIRRIKEGLEEAGIKSVILTGDTTMLDRQAAVDAFQQDPAVRVFIGNIQAAGVGITLTAASHVVFAELDWVPGNVTQAEDRCHRIGQLDSVLVQHIVLDGSLDARMAQALVEKQETADEALDDEPVLALAPAAVRRLEGRPKSYPVATEAERAAAQRGIRYLNDLNPDGARELNGVGFNSADTRIGRELAARERFTDGQVWLARKVLRKYRNTQLRGLAVVSTLFPEEGLS